MLQGIVTAVDRRPGGCILLVLDDGTGSVDVRYWDEAHNHNGAYDLIGLQKSITLNVGDYCEVMGKIKAMTAGTEIMLGVGAAANDADAQLDVRTGCIREIHASSVCVMNQSTNAEVVHWLKCLKFTKDVQQGKVKNGKDVLPLLSDSIVTSIFTENTIVETGNILERKCCQTPQRFRKALLYCRCEGTLETLDPSFVYRDALLNKLLDMEESLQHISHSAYASSTEDCIDLFGGQLLLNERPPPLLFSFESIYKDDELSSLTRQLVATTPVPEANARQLVQNTFRAMTKDGLLSLFDPEADLYVMLSVERVMEPYFSSLARAAVAPPFFVRGVPKKRMNRLRNWFEKR